MTKYIGLFLLLIAFSFSTFAQNEELDTFTYTGGNVASAFAYNGGIMTHYCPGPLSLNADYCATCSHLNGFDSLYFVQNFACSASDAVDDDEGYEEDFPDLSSCFTTRVQGDTVFPDYLTQYNALRICTCVANIAFDNDNENALPQRLSNATVKTMANAAIENSIREASQLAKTFNQFNTGSTCNPLEQLQQKINNDQCGFYSGLIKNTLQSLDQNESYFAGTNLAEAYKDQMTNARSQENPFDEFRHALSRLEQNVDSSHMSAQWVELSRLVNPQNIREHHVSAIEADGGRQGENYRKVVANFNSEFQELVSHYSQEYCQTLTEKLEAVCAKPNTPPSFNVMQAISNIDQHELKMAKEIVGDSRFNSDLQEARRQSYDYFLSLDQDNPERQTADIYFRSNVMVTCDAYKDSLQDAKTRCTYTDSCTQRDNLMGSICHSVIELFHVQHSTYGWLRDVITEKTGLSSPEDLETLLRNEDGCIVNETTEPVYQAVIDALDLEKDIARGVDFPTAESKAITENDTRGRAAVQDPETYALLPAGNSDNNSDSGFGDTSSLSPVIAEPTVAVPLLPELPTDSAASGVAKDSISSFINPYEQSIVGPYTNVDDSEEIIVAEDTVDTSIDPDLARDKEYEALMEQIRNMQSKLDSNQAAMNSVNNRIASEPEGSSEREELELEKIRLENEKLKLEIEQQRLANERQTMIDQHEQTKTTTDSSKITASDDGDRTEAGIAAGATEGFGSGISTDTLSDADGTRSESTSKDAERAPVVQDNGGAAVGSGNGVSLSGVYLSNPSEVTEFLSGNRQFDQAKIILEDPENKDNVIVCILPPDLQKTAVDAQANNEKVGFGYQDYLCGDPVKKDEVTDLQTDTPAEVQEVKKEEVVPEEIPAEVPAEGPGATFQSVKDIVDQAK